MKSVGRQEEDSKGLRSVELEIMKFLFDREEYEPKDME